MRSKLHGKIFLATVLVLVMLSPFCMSPKFTFGAQANAATGVIVPLYSYPGQAWQSLVQTKEAYPSVPVVAIINPSNGPGSYQDQNFVTGIQQLEAAGITVIGYVSTGYGGVAISQAEQETYSYSQLYHLSGVFLDEMSNVPGYENYYSTLTSYASSIGMWLTVGNPGASVPASYIGTVSNIVVYENAGLPSLGFLSGLGFGKSDFSIMSYGDYGFNAGFVTDAAADVGYMFVTDASLPNPYTTLGSYFATLMSTLAGSYGVASSPSVPITIEAVDMLGNPIQGLWTVIQDGQGNIVGTGYSPDTFYGATGGLYQVTMANYGSYVFNHWADGSTGSTKNVAATGPQTLVAYYSSGAAVDPKITVVSADLGGNQIRGLFTTIQSDNGQVFLTGFTPFRSR
jgi:hypothetical protein